MASRDAREPRLDLDALAANTQKIELRTSGLSKTARVVRVFPIRISNASLPVVQESSGRHGLESATAETTVEISPVPSNLGSRSITIPTSAGISSTSTASPLVSATHLVEETSTSGARYITTRFSSFSANSDNHSIKPAVGQKIYRCEDEPIHIPGAVQQFGALIAMRESENGEFLVRIASENSENVTGLKPDALFELRCFTDILTQTQTEEFTIRVRAIRDYDSKAYQDVFSLSLTSSLGAPVPLFCAMHMNEDSDLIICEFELEHDIFNPAHSLTGRSPVNPTPLVDNQAPELERVSSAPSESIPLRSVSVARKMSHQLGPMELFSILTEIQGHLSTATSLPSLLDAVVSLVYELAGFHRTMVYQFDENASGCVVSEHVGAGASIDSYKGLHFPAADIPKQARELYMINTIRVLYDREQETARLVCRTFEDAKTPLNLKHSYLRAMSPIHLKYLENMGVRASMSISLMVGGNLWGLVSCHSYGSGMRVSLPVRELCRGLGSIASSNIEKLIYISRVTARKPLSQAPRPKTSPSSYIAASSTDLLNMFGADFGFLVIKGEARTIGTLLAYAESIALLHYIRKRGFTVVASSHEVMKDYQDITDQPSFSIISGMLVIPLAASGADFLVFFRRGRLKEINWAGNPNEKSVGPGSYLEPRSSFKRWSETVIGTSREWTEDQVESATILSILYGRFIEVWRQKEAIVQRNRMTRLLIRNAGHEVRTPLNSIINYLEVALEETLDEPARHHLQKSLQASKSLVFVVNDLLNLTEAEDADFSVHEDIVDLKDILSEVIAAFEIEAEKRHTLVVLEADMSIPWIVVCDPGNVRTVLSNLLVNAIKHSNGGNVWVTMEETMTSETTSSIAISFQDEGTGLSEQQLNKIFQDFERIMDDDETSSSIQPTQTAEITKRHEIGLGLAITARFVRLNKGQISISSDGEGKGAKVSITLPFRKALQGSLGKRKLSHSVQLPTPPTDPSFALPNSVSSSVFMGTSSPEHSISESSATKEKVVSAGPSNLATTYDVNSTSPSNSTSPLSPISSERGRFPFPTPGTSNDDQKLTILIAEDNPLNSQLLETRLRRRGHEVRVAINGQDCFDSLAKSPAAFDVVLMDIQMPLVDGSEATRLIRHFEHETTPSLSQHATTYGRIPIIAVSASLTERYRDDYVDTGFDGWTLKPIDFKRLEAILAAIQDEQIRKEMLYAKGSWDKGGWFRLHGKDFAGA